MTEPSFISDDIAAELSDAALAEASRHGVRGYSIERELEIWKALEPIVSQRIEQTQPSTCEDFTAELAEAAYEVTLAHGFHGSFLDLQMGLWKAIRRVLRESGLAASYFRSPRPRQEWLQQQGCRELAVA